MTKEKILVTKSSMPDFEDYCRTIKGIWDRTWLTNCGPLHMELEEKISDYLEVNNISLYTNGHLALENALELLDLNGEVITTPFTFVSTTSAIVRTGNKPVFCDIEPREYTIDADKIEDLITDRTVAIVPVHVYGHVCNVEKIEKIAKKHNLKVIYDAAHAFGVKYKGKSIAKYGDISMFSFHATKVFNTIEGGGLAFSDKKLKDKAEALKNFGIMNYDAIDYVGGNAKMSEFQAAMGLCNLKNLKSNILARKHVVNLYRELLKNIDGIIMCDEQDDVISNYAYFPIRVGKDYYLNRDELCDSLEKQGIYSRKYFYPITNCFNAYAEYGGDTPIAKQISDEILTLPLYPDLGDDSVNRICNIIKGGK